MTPPRLLYIAGPMTGVPDLNRPAFADAAARLQGRGFVVVDPAERGADQPGWGWAQYLRRAIRQMLECDAVAVLDGWEASRGANVEVDLAEAVDMPVQPVQFWLDRGPGDGVAGVPTLKEHA